MYQKRVVQKQPNISVTVAQESLAFVGEIYPFEITITNQEKESIVAYLDVEELTGITSANIATYSI